MDKEVIDIMVNDQLDLGDLKHGDELHSPHEGYAVILEEFEEAER